MSGQAAPGSPDGPSPPGVIEENLRVALGARYLTYALSTIMHRALPDVRDGLKPVHRRLLYAMAELGLIPGRSPKKSARVVGDVIGKYHPHGDQAVYDALVRLAQDFSARYPLIDGQGNFGNLDGDNPAAMRYTEARLTPVAMAMLDGIAEGAVDFRPNYDGEEQEPSVMPASFPNLLANGASGIAVGMATAIPPHNAGELCDALKTMIRTPDAGVDALLAHIRGPDFPTGGILVEPLASMRESYRTGRGSFRLRARWEVVQSGRGQYEIIISEIPYQVQRARLVERIAELIAERKLPPLADIRDESTQETRLVLTPRSRTVKPEWLMESLYRLTDLEVRIPLNMNVLIDGTTPCVVSLDKALRHFLDHRRVVLLRRARHRVERIAARLLVVEGHLAVFSDLDRAIAIIRDEDDPKPSLMRVFSLSREQAEGILNMRLRNLRKLEESALRAEHDSLTAEREAQERMLATERLQWKEIHKQIEAVQKAFGQKTQGGARRTRLGEAPPPLQETSEPPMITREPLSIICSRKGWIRALKGHLAPNGEVRFRDGDGPCFHLHGQSSDRLLALASDGRVFTLACDALPRGRGMGEPVRLMIDLPNEARLVSLSIFRPEGQVLLASTDGRGFVAREADLLAQTRNGRQILNPAPDARACLCTPADGDMVASVGDNRKMLVFPLHELPVMARGKGVILQRLRGGKFRDAVVFSREEGLVWPIGGGRMRRLTDLTQWLGKRAGAGRRVPHGFPQNGRFGGGSGKGERQESRA